MESIYSLIKSYENLKIRKLNVNELIERLNLDIKNKSIELEKLQKSPYYETIKELKNKKCFLEEYPKYLKIGFKGFINNILTMFKFFCFIFGFIFIFILFLYMNHSTKIPFMHLLWIDLILSEGISLYGTFIEPVIYEYNTKKDILEKFGNVENLEKEIKKTDTLIQENNLQIQKLENEIAMKSERLKLLTEYFNQLSISEEKNIQQIQNMADDILKSLSREYYIYEIPELDDSFKLKLTK